MSQSLTIVVPGRSHHQATIWDDGVIRYDGYSGSRLGAWQSRVPGEWAARLLSMVGSLPRITKDAGSEAVTVTVTLGSTTKTHRFADDLSLEKGWHLVACFEGVLGLAAFAPLDVTGLVDMAAWVNAPKVHFRQARVSADAVANADGLIVLAGSMASTSTSPTLEPTYVRIRTTLEHEGAFVLHSEAFVVTRHLYFETPSAAASVLGGSNTNGRTAWKRHEGGDWTTLHLD